jgi:hypothetical protein
VLVGLELSPHPAAAARMTANAMIKMVVFMVIKKESPRSEEKDPMELGEMVRQSLAGPGD